MVTKDEFSELSVRVDKLEEAINRLVQVVEKLAASVNKISDGHTVLKHQMLVMQDWVRKAADKIGVEFKL